MAYLGDVADMGDEATIVKSEPVTLIGGAWVTDRRLLPSQTSQREPVSSMTGQQFLVGEHGRKLIHTPDSPT